MRYYARGKFSGSRRDKSKSLEIALVKRFLKCEKIFKNVKKCVKNVQNVSK